MSRVIVLSGIDGSGKTTHARRLVYELRLKGMSAKYLWMRGRGTLFFSLPLLIISRIFGITIVRQLRSELRVSEYPFHRYAAFRLLWPIFQLVDSILYTFLLVYLQIISSSTVLVIDRSCIDTLIDVLYDTQLPLETDLLQRLFLSLLPKGSTVIILDVDERTAMARKKDIPELRCLTIKRSNYNYLARKYHWQLVSTEESFESCHRIIVKLAMLSAEK